MTVTIQTLEAKRFAILGLPPPPTPMKPYLYRFGGLDFGAGTRFIVESFKGIIGYETDASSFRNEGAHGAVPGLQTVNPRTMTLRIRVDAAKGEDSENVIKALKKAFRQPVRQLAQWVGDYDARGYFTDGEATNLRIMRPGWTEPRIIHCVVTAFEIESNYDTSMGNITCDVRFRADDPFAYGYHTKIVTIPRGEYIDWEQDGDVQDGYAPYVVLYGPLKNPKLTRNYTSFFAPEPGNNQVLSFKISGVTDMRIDMRSRLVDPQGAALVMKDKKFWAVAPTNTNYIVRQRLRFDNDLPGAKADIYIREIWL